MSVPFRFDTVLRIRETERDARRQALALQQADEASRRAERDRLIGERQQALYDLRTLTASSGWTAERALARQNHAEQLARDLARAEISLHEAVAQTALRRQELLEADTAVKALEKLADRHHSGQQQAELARDERDRDDLRRPGRAA